MLLKACNVLRQTLNRHKPKTQQIRHLDDVVVGAACGNPVHLRLHVFVDLVLVAELLRRQLTQAPPDGQLATNTGQERTARRSSADE